MENPIKMDDLGVPLFSETSISDIKGPSKTLMIQTLLPSSRVQAEELLARDSNVAFGYVWLQIKSRHSNFKTYISLSHQFFSWFGLVWFLGLKNSTTLSISNFKVYTRYGPFFTEWEFERSVSDDAFEIV